ncbi:transposase [Clostridium saccharobutylicum]|uniref:transposase n=1 Tax=Clostridium saccharobutylicum TaxID=169679 RepID=UPI001591FF22
MYNKYLKGKSLRLIKDEFLELKKRYWGQNLWATVGSVIEETIKRYMKSQELSYREDIFKIEQ